MYVHAHTPTYVQTYIHTVAGWSPMAKPYELSRKKDLIKNNQKARKISTRK